MPKRTGSLGAEIGGSAMRMPFAHSAFETIATAAAAAVEPATLSLNSCDGVTSPRSALEQARTRWAERGPSAYSVTVSYSCFCLPDNPAVVTVDGGVIVSRVYVTGDTVPPEAASAYPDVPGLFQIIEDAIRSGADRVNVTYHPDFGYPISVFIDRD